jgi:SAM-dependent methyltransferase
MGKRIVKENVESHDVLGQAIGDYYRKNAPGKLWIHNTYGPKEEMPVAHYFRSEKDMSYSELFALHCCVGSILDIGAGAGSHALLLQEMGYDVTALDISPNAVSVMKSRGVSNVIERDIFKMTEPRFDTLLLLMNGIGLAGTVAGLHRFLKHAKTLLNTEGQLLFDSSDVAYLYDGKVPEMENYYGEIDYQYEYKKQKTGWFKWLYVDQEKLKEIAREEGWETEILCEDDHDQYLARLVLAS